MRTWCGEAGYDHARQTSIRTGTTPLPIQFSRTVPHTSHLHASRSLLRQVLLSLLRLYRDEQTLQVTFFIGAPPGKVRGFKSRGFALQRPYASGRKLKRMRWKHRLATTPGPPSEPTWQP